jgi:signal recognition particle subunit SRP54
MFSFLTNKFYDVFDSLRGISKLDEESLSNFFQKVKDNLIQADVPLKVIDLLIDNLKKECIGIKISKHLKPDEYVSKKLLDNLINLLGGSNKSKKDFIYSFIFKSNKFRKNPIIISVAGLQGAGKTTLISKLANKVLGFGLKIKKESVACLSLDFDRPAAKEQLKILSESIGIDFLEYHDLKNPIDVANRFKKEQAVLKKEIIFIDVAGRLSNDKDSMMELDNIFKIISPDINLLVIDAMMGQGGIEIIEEFTKLAKFDGAIITKVDSEAGGGIVLGIVKILSLPILYSSYGEKPDEIEIFNPERAAGLILGDGDIIGMAEIASKKILKEDVEAMENAIKRGDITIDEYVKLLESIEKMGPMKNIISMAPRNIIAGGEISDENIQDVERGNKNFKAMRNSMTKKERRFPSMVIGSQSRRIRIAKGSGLQEKEIVRLLEFYNVIKGQMKMFKKMQFFM